MATGGGKAGVVNDQGSELLLARDAVAQGSAPAVVVNTDAGDGGSGGSGLRLARALRKQGRGEDNPPPPFISHQRQPKGPFPLNFAIIANLSLLHHLHFKIFSIKILTLLEITIIIIKIIIIYI